MGAVASIGITSAHAGSLFLSLVFLIKAPLGGADIYTSSVKMSDLAASEFELIDTVLTFPTIKPNTVNVAFGGNQEFRGDDNLRSFAEFRRNVIGTRGEAGEPLHPNAAMLLLRAFRSRWNVAISKSPELTNVISAYNVELPQQTDMSGILAGILRLQRTYNLKTSNIYAGDYLGFRGPALSPLTAYAIGAQAFTDGLLSQSVDWMQQAIGQMRLAASAASPAPTRTDSEDPGVYDDRKIAGAIALYGRALLYRGDFEEASVQFRHIQRLDPSNPEGLALGDELRNPPQKALSREDISTNVTLLCSRPKGQTVETIKSFHRCRFKPSMWVPYLRFKEEILSIKPYASIFHQVIHQREIDRLITLTKQQVLMSPATVEIQGRSYIRVSERGWMKDNVDPVVRELSRRVQEITWLRTFNNDHGTHTSEAFQVLNYGLGGHYNLHHDILSKVKPNSKLAKAGVRISTFLIYLSDVDIGGNTIFSKAGISVSPIKGSALFWYNVTPAQERDDLTKHAGCPVLKGHKWVSNKWIWTYGNMYRRPCGPSLSSSQLDVESIMYSRRHNLSQ